MHRNLLRVRSQEVESTYRRIKFSAAFQSQPFSGLTGLPLCVAADFINPATERYLEMRKTIRRFMHPGYAYTSTYRDML